MIKTKSKGKLSLQAISRDCGWSPSRLNQILNHFGKYWPKKVQKQEEIMKKLNQALDSVNRINQGESDNDKNS